MKSNGPWQPSLSALRSPTSGILPILRSSVSIRLSTHTHTHTLSVFNSRIHIHIFKGWLTHFAPHPKIAISNCNQKVVRSRNRNRFNEVYWEANSPPLVEGAKWLAKMLILIRFTLSLYRFIYSFFIYLKPFTLALLLPRFGDNTQNSDSSYLVSQLPEAKSVHRWL